jgi:hypothetical protein
MKLSNKLDDITRVFFETWRAWRYAQGWRLGPDLPSSMLSPHMVDNWDQLHDEGRKWFQQQAALVLVAVEQVVPEYVVVEKKVIPSPKKKLIPINTTGGEQ